MPPSVGRPAGVSADCVLLRDYSAGRFWSTTREVDGRQALPMFWINIWSQSSFGVAKWLMLIVLINNSKSWSGTSSQRGHTESAVNNESTCPVEPRDGGPAADTRTVNELVGPRSVGRSWTFLTQRTSAASDMRMLPFFHAEAILCRLFGKNKEDEKLKIALWKLPQLPASFI